LYDLSLVVFILDMMAARGIRSSLGKKERKIHQQTPFVTLSQRQQKPNAQVKDGILEQEAV
jgi:hypothetical protein